MKWLLVVPAIVPEEVIGKRNNSFCPYEEGCGTDCGSDCGVDCGCGSEHGTPCGVY